jgi:hypothetical protein
MFRRRDVEAIRLTLYGVAGDLVHERRLRDYLEGLRNPLVRRQSHPLKRILVEQKYFAPTFVDDYNRRFAREPRSAHNAHRPLPTRALDRVFTWQEKDA